MITSQTDYHVTCLKQVVLQLLLRLPPLSPCTATACPNCSTCATRNGYLRVLPLTVKFPTLSFNPQGIQNSHLVTMYKYTLTQGFPWLQSVSVLTDSLLLGSQYLVATYSFPHCHPARTSLALHIACKSPNLPHYIYSYPLACTQIIPAQVS